MKRQPVLIAKKPGRAEHPQLIKPQGNDKDPSCFCKYILIIPEKTSRRRESKSQKEKSKTDTQHKKHCIYSQR